MRILLSGYFGFGNIGDEMIHSVIRQRLKNKDLEIVSLVKNPRNDEEIDRANLKDVYKAIKSSDVVISGGGGLLQDKTSSKSFFYYLSIIWLAKKMGKKAVVFAQGIGPVEKNLNKKLMGRVINMADLVTVRDNNSKELLLECDVTKQINVTADIAFLYPFEENEEKKEEYVLISFGKHTTNPPLELLGEIVNYIKEKTNQQVLLSTLFPGRDKEIIEGVANLTDTKIAETSSIEKTISIFSNSIFAIGTRYHSLVVSTMKQIPSLGLSYDPKVNSLAEEVSIPVLPYNSSLNLDKFKMVFDKAFRERENTKIKLKDKFIKLKERAEENFKLLYDTILD